MKAVSFGKHIEELAQEYCKKQRLQIKCCNFRSRVGEIDIVAQDDGCLVFIEVRYRCNNAYGGAAESVTWTKQRKLVYAAQHFLQIYSEYADMPCRFDVLAISGTVSAKSSNKLDLAALQIEWIKDAFNE